MCTCPQCGPPEALRYGVVPAEVVSVREEQQPESLEPEDLAVVDGTRGGHDVPTATQNEALQFRARGHDHVDIHFLDNLKTQIRVHIS
jgi:hypothetical protein